MDYKTCRTCGSDLEINKENFYYTISAKGRYKFSSPDCRECYAEKDKAYRERIKEQDEYGSDMIISKPNKYVDHIQKEQTFKFLTLMGWKFNEEKGIWYDDIKKTKDGEFIGVWAKRGKYDFTEETYEPLIFSSHDYTRDRSKDQLVQDMLKDFFLYRMKSKDVMDKYDVKEHYFNYYSSKYRRQIREKSSPEKRRIYIQHRKDRKNVRQPIHDLPTIKLVHKKLIDKYTPEFVKQIQKEYFIDRLKIREIVEKYKDDENTVMYIITKTMRLLKNNKDAT